MNHILLGSTLPFLIGIGLYYSRGRKQTLRYLIFIPLLMATGALWAVIPDLPRALGFHELYTTLSNSPWCDIFLWHYSIDLSEADNPSPAYTLPLMIYAIALIRIGMLELRSREEAS